MSVPVYPGSVAHNSGQHRQLATTAASDQETQSETTSTHTGTPSLTDSAPIGAALHGSATPSQVPLPASSAQAPSHLGTIHDVDESDHDSLYQDVPSGQGSRPVSRPLSRSAGPGPVNTYDPYDPYSQPEAPLHFPQAPMSPQFASPNAHPQAMATGLLQPTRPALVHRASSRNADRGHPFSVEQMATDAVAGPHQDNFRADHQEPFFDPTWHDFMQEEPLEMPFFDHVVQRYGEFGPVEKARLAMRQFFSFCITFSVLGAVLFVSIAHAMNPFAKRPPRSRADREYETRITGERGSARVQYYCEFWGYTCDEYDIVTEGGWILKAHRISDPRRKGGPGYPVVCQHGILCNSSHFVVCEERSLAFWLVDQGYDVWLTNIRSNYEAGHTEFGRDDPRFWAFGLKELALDLKDVVEFICEATGFARLAYIGHSQGSGSMYAALSPGLVPELGDRLSVFVALGPSVYAGPVLRRFPFSLMRRFRSRQWWSLIFGVKVYIPAIGLFHRVLPTWIFGHIAAALFAYMFNFNMALTPKRQIPKLFRTAAVSTSSELLYWYMAAWAHRGCIFDPRLEQPWFPPSFPPHSMFYGSVDMLVIGKPLADRLLTYEKHVDVLHCVELDGYEHLDFLFAHDAWRVVYPGILDSIEATTDDDDFPVNTAEEVGPTYEPAARRTSMMKMPEGPIHTVKIAPEDYDYGRMPPPAFGAQEPYHDRTFSEKDQHKGGYRDSGDGYQGGYRDDYRDVYRDDPHGAGYPERPQTPEYEYHYN